MDWKRVIDGCGRFVERNFLLLGSFVCFAVALELMRVPLFGATFVAVLTRAPSTYDFAEVAVQMLLVAADALVLSLPALLVGRRRWILWLWIFLFDVYCLIQILYAQVYHDMMPFSHFLLVENVGPVLLRSVGGLLAWRDILLFVPLVLFVALSQRFPKRAGGGTGAVLKTIALALVFYAVSVVFNVVHNRQEGRYSFFKQYLSASLLRIYACENGFIPYVAYSVANTFSNKNLTETELAEIRGFIAEKPRYSDNPYAHPERKNLILVIVESFNSWYLNLSVCGTEIMPNLNKALREPGTVSALHIAPQVRDGRSSDGQFCYNTGLLPLRTGAVAVTYSGNEFPSLAKALKERGYASFCMVCDNAGTWNQSELSVSLGFDRFYDRTYSGSPCDLDDSELLENALVEMRKMKQPFFAQIVTLATHQPGKKPEHPTPLSAYPAQSTRVTYGMEGFHRLDALFGRFFSELKAAGLWDNSVVVIIADHDEVGYNEFQHRSEALPSDRECAFIALNTSSTLAYPNTAGQIDVYPTLLDIVGCNGYGWKGLGNSLLRCPAPDCAVDAFGSVWGNAQSPMLGYYSRAWDVAALIIKGDYFRKH